MGVQATTTGSSTILADLAKQAREKLASKGKTEGLTRLRLHGDQVYCPKCHFALLAVRGDVSYAIDANLRVDGSGTVMHARRVCGFVIG